MINKKYLIIGLVFILIFSIGFVSAENCKTDKYETNKHLTESYDPDGPVVSGYDATEIMNFIYYEEDGWIGYGTITRVDSGTNSRGESYEFTTITTITCSNSICTQVMEVDGEELINEIITSPKLVLGLLTEGGSWRVNCNMLCDLANETLTEPETNYLSNCQEDHKSINFPFQSCEYNHDGKTDSCSYSGTSTVKNGYCCTDSCDNPTEDYVCDFDELRYDNAPYDPLRFLSHPNDGCYNLDRDGDGQDDSCCGEVGKIEDEIANIGIIVTGEEEDTCEFDTGTNRAKEKCVECEFNYDCDEGMSCCNGKCYNPDDPDNVCCGLTGGSQNQGDFRDCRTLGPACGGNCCPQGFECCDEKEEEGIVPTCCKIDESDCGYSNDQEVAFCQVHPCEEPTPQKCGNVFGDFVCCKDESIEKCSTQLWKLVPGCRPIDCPPEDVCGTFCCDTPRETCHEKHIPWRGTLEFCYSNYCTDGRPPCRGVIGSEFEGGSICCDSGETCFKNPNGKPSCLAFGSSANSASCFSSIPSNIPKIDSNVALVSLDTYYSGDYDLENAWEYSDEGIKTLISYWINS
jgi:hypothetical protein